MHRSSSMTRVADDYYKNLLTSSSPATGADGDSGNNLPVYTKKDKYRLRLAENAVHLIPLVLLLCAIILWFFSNPVDVVNKKHGGITGNREVLKVTTGTGIHGTQSTTLMPHFELEDVDIFHHHLHNRRQATENEPSV